MSEIFEVPESIDSLIESHGSRVMALLARVLRDPDEARDAYQDTWTSVWRALPRLRSDADPWPYIRRAALSKAIDHLRARRNGVAIRHCLDDRAAPEIPDRGPVEVDLTVLSRAERSCLTMFFWEGRSVREIAAAMDVPVGTVKTWMFRARARLREQIGDGGA